MIIVENGIFCVGVQDEERLKIVKENLKKSSQLREQIVNVLDSFDNRLKSLEATVVPLHEKTGRLQKKQQSWFKLCATLST